MIQTKRRALITGVTGQDGAYLSRYLLSKGYEVFGLRRRVSSFKSAYRIESLLHDPKFHLIYGDITDSMSIIAAIKNSEPSEIYNLAAQSHVAVSFENPEYTAQVDALGILKILEGIKILGITNDVKVYQASTSELFGTNKIVPQSETTPFYPASPYGAAKLYAFWLSKIYRDAYGFHVSNGILFNHESPLRGENFVSMKIIDSFKKRMTDESHILRLGNLDSIRDWGHAEDYVEAMYLILQQEKPADYVIATGVSDSVREFISIVAEKLNFSLEWKGNGLHEKGLLNGKPFIEIDPTYLRPLEVPNLCGDATKARVTLNWMPKHTLDTLISDMLWG
jgi:GDPmannose 4,6-dehydratase